MGIGEQFEFEKTGRIDPEPAIAKPEEPNWVDAKNSSNVISFRYLSKKKELYVRFKGGTYQVGSCYRYLDVPDDLYQEMHQAESIGQFLNLKIKGKFECEKVEEDD